MQRRMLDTLKPVVRLTEDVLRWGANSSGVEILSGYTVVSCGFPKSGYTQLFLMVFLEKKPFKYGMIRGYPHGLDTSKSSMSYWRLCDDELEVSVSSMGE